MVGLGPSVGGSIPSTRTLEVARCHIEVQGSVDICTPSILELLDDGTAGTVVRSVVAKPSAKDDAKSNGI